MILPNNWCVEERIKHLVSFYKKRLAKQSWDEWLIAAEHNIETYMWIVMGISTLCFGGIILWNLL